MNLNFEALLQKLVLRGVGVARSTPPMADSRSPTSIRLKPSTRHFIECQAESLGASAQAVIGMILDGVAEASLDETSAVLRTIRERFFYLFEAHQINMPGIVSLLGSYGFRLSTLSSGDALLDHLTTDVIRHISQLFHIAPSWLSGSGESITNISSEENQGHACRRIIKYNAEGLQPRVIFIRRCNADFETARLGNDRSPEEPIGFAIELHRATDDGVQFKTYELWEFQQWNNRRARFHIKHVIAFCEAASRRQTGINYVGYELPQDTIDKLRREKVLPTSALSGSHNIWLPNKYAGEQHQLRDRRADSSIDPSA